MGRNRSTRWLTILFSITLAVGLALAFWGCGQKDKETKAENNVSDNAVGSTQQSESVVQADTVKDPDSAGSQSVETKAEPTKKAETDIQARSEQEASKTDAAPKPQSTTTKAADKPKPRKLPKMVDLGRNTCIPCKMMAPILEELKKEYEGRAIIEVIDLRDDMEAARRYRIRVIPTQIFFDSEGNEVWRHEGYMPKEQIVAKLAELGAKPVK